MKRIMYRILKTGLGFSVSVMLYIGIPKRNYASNDFFIFHKEIKIENAEPSILLGVPNIYDNSAINNVSLFENAINIGDNDFVQLLLRLGIDVNKISSTGETPLFLSLRKKLDEILKTLLENGANPNCRNYVGESPLDYVIRKGNSAQARLLLRFGADMNTRDKRGRTPLMNAVLQNKYRHAKVLLKEGAQSTIEDYEGKSVFDYCADPSLKISFHLKQLFGQLKEKPTLMIRLKQNDLLAKFIKQKPEEIYGIDRDGNTLYHYAVLFDNMKALGILPDNSRVAQANNDIGKRPDEMVIEQVTTLILPDTKPNPPPSVGQLDFDEESERLLANFERTARAVNFTKSSNSLIGSFRFFVRLVLSLFDSEKEQFMPLISQSAERT